MPPERAVSAEPRIAPPNTETPFLPTREIAEGSGASCPACGNERFTFGQGAFNTTLQGVGEPRVLPDSVKAAFPCNVCNTMLVATFTLDGGLNRQENTSTFQAVAPLATEQLKRQEEDERRRLENLRPEVAREQKRALVDDLLGVDRSAAKAPASASAARPKSESANKE